MAIEEIFNQTIIGDLIGEMSALTTIFQAIGGLIIIYIIVATINLISTRKKEKELHRMRVLLEQINKKLDKKR